jgi:hypothetical protein
VFTFNFLLYPKEIHEAWAACEALRRLGFEYGDVSLQADLDNDMLQICLNTQGMELEWPVATLVGDPEAVFANWARIEEAMLGSEIPPVVLELVWERSHAYNHGMLLIMALMQHGFNIPNKG